MISLDYPCTQRLYRKHIGVLRAAATERVTKVIASTVRTPLEQPKGSVNELAKMRTVANACAQTPRQTAVYLSLSAISKTAASPRRLVQHSSDDIIHFIAAPRAFPEPSAYIRGTCRLGIHRQRSQPRNANRDSPPSSRSGQRTNGALRTSSSQNIFSFPFSGTSSSSRFTPTLPTLYLPRAQPTSPFDIVKDSSLNIAQSQASW